MKKFVSLSALLCSVLFCSFAVAQDELIVYAEEDGLALQGATVLLDGEQEETVPASGIVTFDLDAGGHAVQIVKDGAVIHSFRFDSAEGQYADIFVSIDNGQGREAVETYFETETSAQRFQATTGTVRGVVSIDNQPVANATVSFLGATTVVTEADGSYQAEIPRGVYDVEIDHSSLSATRNEIVRAVANLTITADYYYSGTSVDSGASSGGFEEMVVITSVDPRMFGESEQFSDGVVNTIGIEQLARFGDSDVAASIIRVPAVTVQDDKYVFIRGLGGRYITTTLNGATMPSTDPNRRSVPLDLFPSNMVDQLTIRKTFLASSPGESTGGNLVIDTRSFPDERAGKISISLGGNSDVTGNTVATDPISGDWDFWGVDDSSRKESGIVEAIAKLVDREASYPELDGASIDSFLNQNTRIALQRIAAEYLVDGWDLDTKTANPDIGVTANYGDLFYFGDSEIGLFVAGNYKNNWTTKEGISRTYSDIAQDGSLIVEDDFVESEVANNIEVSGLLSVSANIGNTTLEAVSLISRVTESSVQQQEGIDGDSVEPSIRHTIVWEEQQYLSQQFKGEHVLTDELYLDWQVTGSEASRYAPDRREVRFNQENPADPFSLEIGNLIRRFDYLVDENFDGSFDFAYDIDFDTDIFLSSTVNFGAQAIHRERDSDSQTYGFLYGEQLNDFAPNLLVSDVLNLDNITGDQGTGFAFNEDTLPSDSYDAEMDLNSIYFSTDTSIGDSLQVVAGVRYEDFEQLVNTFALTGAMDEDAALIDESVTLPALAVNWSITASQQIRLGLSKTVSRPDFKEASNAVFYDTDFTDIRVRGNPDLMVSDISNYDLRWEMYGDGPDKLSIALFYKDITDAIERVALTASGTAGNSRTFANAESAELYGIEIDAYREFSFNDSYTQSIFTAVNASFIESEVEGLDRQLQGQPEYTFNLILGWDDIDSGQELTLLFNQNGESIRDVDVRGLSDIIEEPAPELNINYSWQMNDAMKISFKAKNLLNPDIEFSQNGAPFRRFKKGVGFEAGFEWTL